MWSILAILNYCVRIFTMTYRNHARANKSLILINAIVAYISVGISFSLMFIGYYANSENIDLTEPTLLGNSVNGTDQVWERFFDWISYFTIWSNIVVAIVLTVLWLRPDVFERNNASGTRWRALRLDSILMITITGIVYNVLLAEPKTGIDAVSNAMIHIVNPIFTLLVFLITGPRGLLRLSTVFYSLVVPITWATFAIVRGMTLNSYPYPFFDVSENGLPYVLMFVAQIMALAVVLALVLLGYDKLMTKGRRT
jgi:hypothetical protein